MKPLLTLLILFHIASINPAGAQTWTELFPSGGPSGGILDRQPTGYGYDSTNNRLIVYFQGNPAAGAPPSEVWVLASANGLGGIPAWTRLSPAGVEPPVNGASGVAYDQVSNRLIVD